MASVGRRPADQLVAGQRAAITRLRLRLTLFSHMRSRGRNVYGKSIKQNIDRFDTSNYPENNIHGIPKTVSVISKMKDEYAGVPIVLLYGTGAKACCMQTVNDEKAKVLNVHPPHTLQRRHNQHLLSKRQKQLRLFGCTRSNIELSEADNTALKVALIKMIVMDCQPLRV
ncbi:hypothetical protein TcasGA2_TC002047 [Tribolium castaneum]|uniref:Uncharacterized protein n=1 Tax=Tribolium castaneum TaxID=7070 RepID=D7ELN3_TRICA|nr:hypothetical protein TcasGA2_TC002047 [Tribolium castaneum]